MSLLARIALVGGVLLAVAIAVAIFVWQPASRDTFVQRTGGLLGSTRDDYTEFATTLVNRTMTFAADSAKAADRQRAFAIQGDRMARHASPSYPAGRQTMEFGAEGRTLWVHVEQEGCSAQVDIRGVEGSPDDQTASVGIQGRAEAVRRR